MPVLKNFTEKIIGNFSKLITDKIFLMIQNDHDLMREYLLLIQEKGVKTVNTYIGKQIKANFNLSSLPDKQSAPVSTLIQSHETFDSRRPL